MKNKYIVQSQKKKIQMQIQIQIHGNVSVQLRLDQPIRLSPVYCTCSLLILLVLHTYLAHIRLSNVHYYFTHQYTDYSVVFSHFIFLTWYQSHSFDFLVPVNISGVLLLPSPSSSIHCQKRVIAVTSIVPATLGSYHYVHPTAKAKAQSD